MTAFSIVIPVYNVEDYVRECLDSIINQTFGDFEVLCVNDCSPDNSLAILEEYASKDSRFKVINFEHNRGVSAARNAAIDSAQGEYLICIDPDDWIAPTLLERVYDAFQRTNADGIWYDSYYYIEGEQPSMERIRGEEFFTKPEGYVDITPDNMLGMTDYVGDKSYKLSKINEFNIRFPEGLFFEDAEYYFKCAYFMPKVYYLNESFYYYRKRATSTVNQGQKGNVKVKDLFDVFMNIYNFILEQGVFEKYKEVILVMFLSRIRTLLIPGQKEVALKLGLETLEKINFPEAYEDLGKKKSIKIWKD